ncbi:FAD-binding protein [Nocardioides convexus]|uniref:FAD-binding protein n=1 Tax=Nocardioides convexus TaxID=2712224 RepID=UPI00241821D5|nr:FAD-binding protein [Nocardioides convexus]
MARLASSYAAIPAGETVRLAKRTTNLFRARAATSTPGLDVSGLDGVIEVVPDGPDGPVAEVQGMCTYEDLVDATLPHGLVPAVVPQLRTITLGGAVTGLGIESTSFRLGLPHETVLEMDVFTGAGEVVTTRPGDEFVRRLPQLLRLARLRDAAADQPAARAVVRRAAAPALRRRRVDGEDPGRHRRDERARRRGGARSRRRLLRPRRARADPGPVDRRARPHLRLRRPGHLLPLAAAHRPGPADRLRLPVALGHRLVLVLGRLRRAEPEDPPPLAAVAAALGRLHAPAPPRPPLRHRRQAGPPRRPAAARARRAGHRGAGGEPAGLPGVVRRGDRDAAGLAVPARRDAGLAALPAGGRPALRQRRVLGHRPRRRGRPECPEEPGDRAEGHRAWAATSRSTPRRSTTARRSTRSTTPRTWPQ